MALSPWNNKEYCIMVVICEYPMNQTLTKEIKHSACLGTKKEGKYNTV